MNENIEKIYKKIDYENLLNKQQLEAVNSLYGPVLCIAGAGTGKTRTLVFRLAKMLENNIAPENILLLTFTKKAAANMLRKASDLIGKEALNVAGGTYHAFASSMLKKYGQYCGISNDFSILDEADAENIIGFLKNEKNYFSVDNKYPDKRILSKIFSKSRNFNLPIELTLETGFKRYADFAEEIQNLYRIYTEYKFKNSMLDYDDLLLGLYKLLTESETAKESICERYKYIMADEYQDTNELQAKITISLAGNEKNIMVVGDDAQSIYSFRGACIDNILNFPKHFDSCKIIKLEQN